jgi:hypothetical protein
MHALLQAGHITLDPRAIWNNIGGNWRRRTPTYRLLLSHLMLALGTQRFVVVDVYKLLSSLD